MGQESFFWQFFDIKRVSARLWTLDLLFFIALALGCGGGRVGEEPGGQKEVVRAVRVMKPGVEDLRWTLNVVGTVEFERQIQVVSRVGGTVAEVFVEDGAWVLASSPLVRLESGELVAARQRLQAQAEQVAREREFLCESGARQRRLVEAGAGTRVAAESAEAQCAGAEQGLRAARAALSEVEERLGYLGESAPFSGVIVEKMVEVGEHIMPGRPLFLLGSKELEVQVAVSEGDMERGIEVGMQVLLKAGTGRAKGVVRRVSARRRGPGRMSLIHVGFEPEDEEGWRAGASVEASFVLAERAQAVVVRGDAVVKDGDQSWVFVVREGRVERVAVEVGLEVLDQVEILSPLSLDEQVVVSAVGGLEEGQRVYAVEVEGLR